MAYFTKEDILEYVDTNIEKMSGKPLNPKEEVSAKLETEEDVVGFFWIELENQEDGVKPKMFGKMFVKIYHNIYTDDRYAIDAYNAQAEGVTVADIIIRRNREQEMALKSIGEKNDESFEKLAKGEIEEDESK